MSDDDDSRVTIHAMWAIVVLILGITALVLWAVNS